MGVRNAPFVVLVIVLLTVLAACNGDIPSEYLSTNTTTPAPAVTTPSPKPTVTVTATVEPPPPEPIGEVVLEQPVSAAAGATLKADNGGVTLEIPAGALPADTNVQIRKVQPDDIPQTNQVFPAGDIYDFQPDGTTLTQPATVTYRVPASSLDPLGLDPGQQPLLMGLTRSDDGTWEILSDVAVSVDSATGDIIVTASMWHFCTSVFVAVPVRTVVDPPQIELTTSESWSTSITIINDHATMPIYIQQVDFYCTPRIFVADGGGDLNLEIPVGPGQQITLTQEGKNKIEAAGPGTFGSNISFSLVSGNSEKGADADVHGWIQVSNWLTPPGRVPTPTNTLDASWNWYNPDAPTIDVTPVNDPPVIGDYNADGTVDVGDIYPDATVTVSVDNVNDPPVFGDTNPDGTVTTDDVLPKPISTDTVSVDDWGLDPTVTSTDTGSTWDTSPDATVTITVTPVNDAPVIPSTGYDPRWDFWNIALGGLPSGGPAILQTLVGHFLGISNVPLTCFHPDTPVMMADGTVKAIGDINAGDSVMAYDTTTGIVVAAPVTATGGGIADHYYLINGALRVTPPHPFRTGNGQWVKIQDLRPGDVIIGLDGTTEIFSIEYVNAAQEICNISVAGYGNYFVSANGVDFFLVREGP